jgi:hypothetical protein
MLMRFAFHRRHKIIGCGVGYFALAGLERLDKIIGTRSVGDLNFKIMRGKDSVLYRRVNRQIIAGTKLKQSQMVQSCH